MRASRWVLAVLLAARVLAQAADGTTVAGQVVDADGRGVAGVPVYAEDAMAATKTTTDAAGRFACAHLPEPPTRLVALRGRRELAVAVVQAGGEQPRMALREVPMPTWADAPTAADRQMAADLLRAADGQRERGRLMVLADEQAAIRVVKVIATGRGSFGVSPLPAGVVVGEASVAEVERMEPGDGRSVAAWFVGDLVPRERRDLFARLLACAVQGPSGQEVWRRRQRELAVAALSERAGAERAAEDRAKLVAACAADPKRLDDVWWLGIQTALPVPLLLALLGEEIGSTVELRGFAMDVPDLTYRMVQEAVVIGLAMRNGAEAVALARRWSGRRGKAWLPETDPFSFLFQIPSLEPAFAPYLTRDEAKLQLARCQDPSFALRMAMLAADAGSRGYWLERFDELDKTHGVRDSCALALQLLSPERAEQRLRQKLPAKVSEAQLGVSGQVAAARYLVLVDPNRARAMLDAVWVSGPGQTVPLAEQIAPAMAAVDPERAVAMAGGPRGNRVACMAVARWLLANRVERCIEGGVY